MERIIAKVYEFVITPSGGCEELFGESLYILVDNEEELRAKFEKWVSENYDPEGKYGSGETPLPLEEIWSSRIICSDESGDGIFTRGQIRHTKSNERIQFYELSRHDILSVF